MKPRRRGAITPVMNELLECVAEEFPALTLIGGTALVEFYLGHRFSEDLDFASPDLDVIDRLEGPLISVLKKRRFRFTIGLPIRGAIVAHVKKTARSPAVKVEFSTNPYLRKNAIASCSGVRVPGIRHLMELKWRALPREELKDVFDLAALEKEGIRAPWPQEIAWAAPALAMAESMLNDWQLSPPGKPGWHLGHGDAWLRETAEMTEFLRRFSKELRRHLSRVHA